MNKRDYHLKRKYGITHEIFDDLLKQQAGNCAVCGRASTSFRTRLAVDHDHTTGEIRGLLCNHCNRYVIGRYRKGHNIELLRLAYEYLIKQYTGWIVPAKKKKKRRKKCRKKVKKEL